MRTVHFLLDRLQNFDTKEPTDTSGYTVEHVLPQNERLTKAWKEMLGAEWQRVQQEWSNRLGNLTLTGYNSTYSDRSFEDKKTIKGGFNESAVRLNKSIRDASRWTATDQGARRHARQEGARGLAATRGQRGDADGSGSGRPPRAGRASTPSKP